MSMTTVFTCFILLIGLWIAGINKNKHTDYLDKPSFLTLFLIVLLFLIITAKNSYLFQNEMLKSGFNDLYIILIIFSPVLFAFLISIVSPEKNNNTVSELYEISLDDRFMSSFDEAKKADFKDEWQKAIGLYQDTLYYLKNDYKKLSEKGEKKKQAHIDICEKSILRIRNRK